MLIYAESENNVPSVLARHGFSERGEAKMKGDTGKIRLVLAPTIGKRLGVSRENRRPTRAGDRAESSRSRPVLVLPTSRSFR